MFCVINRVFEVIWLMFSIFSMFSKNTPCSAIRDCRILQYLEPLWMLMGYHTFHLIGGDMESALEQNPVFHTFQVSHQLKWPLPSNGIRCKIFQLKNTTVRSESLYPVMRNTQLRCLELTSNDEFLVRIFSNHTFMLALTGFKMKKTIRDEVAPHY